MPDPLLHAPLAHVQPHHPLAFYAIECEGIFAGRPAFTPCVLGYFLGGKAPSGLLKVGQTEYFQRRLYVLEDISLFPEGIMLVMALILHGPPFVQRDSTAVIVAVQNNVFNPSLFSVTHGMWYVILGVPWVVRILQKRGNILGNQTKRALLKQDSCFNIPRSAVPSEEFTQVECCSLYHFYLIFYHAKESSFSSN